MRIAGALAVSLAAVVLCACGCKSSYTWTSGVPREMRSVFVPTFRNDSSVTELGSVTARQVLREFQREGTFRVAHPDDAALEIQGEIRSASAGYGYGDRRSGMRLAEYTFTISAVVSVIDRRNGRVLVNNRAYRGETTFVSGEDRLTGERNASGRAAEDLAGKIVDDVTSMSF